MAVRVNFVFVIMSFVCVTLAVTVLMPVAFVMFEAVAMLGSRVGVIAI